MITKKQKILEDAMKYLQDIPQMNTIFANLPSGITYNIAEDLSGMACYNGRDNSITINEGIFVDDANANQQLIFLITLAHELCHASQKKAGLSFNDLINSSFDETFRVSRMTEIESVLLETIVENELLKRKKFEDCEPSDNCLFYRNLLQQTKDDVQQTNRYFILSYWKNSVFKLKENAFIKSFKADIDNHYHHYIKQVYHNAIAMHKYNRRSTNSTQPLLAMGKYLERMNLRGMLPEMFLQNNFDNIEATKNVEDGITVLDQNGNKCYKYSPTTKQHVDMITYFKDGLSDKILLLDNIDNTQKDITDIITNLQNLEKAIKTRNMAVLRQIFNKNPWILNTQALSDGRFPLLMAIRNNNAEAVAFILEKSPNLLLSITNDCNILTELHKLTNKHLREKIQYMYIQQIKAQMFGCNPFDKQY